MITPALCLGHFRFFFFCTALYPDVPVSLSCPAPTQLSSLSSPSPTANLCPPSPAPAALCQALTGPGSPGLSRSWGRVRVWGTRLSCGGGTVRAPAEPKSTIEHQRDTVRSRGWPPLSRDFTLKLTALSVSERSGPWLSSQGPPPPFLQLSSFSIQTPRQGVLPKTQKSEPPALCTLPPWGTQNPGPPASSRAPAIVSSPLLSSLPVGTSLGSENPDLRVPTLPGAVSVWTRRGQAGTLVPGSCPHWPPSSPQPGSTWVGRVILLRTSPSGEPPSQKPTASSGRFLFSPTEQLSASWLPPFSLLRCLGPGTLLRPQNPGVQAPGPSALRPRECILPETQKYQPPAPSAPHLF